jgi:hypothetical protein
MKSEAVVDEKRNPLIYFPLAQEQGQVEAKEAESGTSVDFDI